MEPGDVNEEPEVQGVKRNDVSDSSAVLIFDPLQFSLSQVCLFLGLFHLVPDVVPIVSSKCRDFHSRKQKA